MVFIIGGRSQGKLDFALREYGPRRVIDLSVSSFDDVRDGDIAVNLHEGIRNLLRDGINPVEYIESLLPGLGNTVFIGDETGSGIVPLEPEERAWRDETGRAYQLMTKYSERVDRVFAGINLVLKG